MSNTELIDVRQKFTPMNANAGKREIVCANSKYVSDGYDVSITAADIERLYQTAEIVFRGYNPEGQKLHFICYGNNAGALAQMGNMLCKGEQHTHIYNIPSCGYAKSVHGSKEIETPHITEDKTIRDRYVALYEAIGLTPDAVVDSDESERYIWVRPLAVTSRSYECLGEVMEQWVEECAQKRYPDSEEKRRAYKDTFFTKTTVIGVKSEKMRGKETQPMIESPWSTKGSQVELRVPNAVSHSLRNMRSVDWLDTYNRYYKNETTKAHGATGISRVNYEQNAKSEYGRNTDETVRLLDAMQACVEAGGNADWWKDIHETARKWGPFKRKAPRISEPELVEAAVERYREGVTGGNVALGAVLGAEGLELTSDRYIGAARI